MNRFKKQHLTLTLIKYANRHIPQQLKGVIRPIYRFGILGYLYLGPTGSLIRSRKIKHYFDSHPIRKLQIGAGSNVMKGWLNTDMDPKSREIVFLDATKPLPFKDYNFNYVFAEHCIEHLTYNEGLCMLRECYRILKPGGRIRIATPSLETLVGLYTPHKSELQQRFISWIIDSFLPEVRIYNECFVVNNAFRNPNWGHKFIYDRVTLEMAMKKSGFTNVAHYMPGQSDDAVLRGIEAHGLEDMNRFETMVLEAERSLEVDNPS